MGENGKGIQVRVGIRTPLARRFLDLDTIADRIEFRQEDGLMLLGSIPEQKDVVFFIDPPYTAGGKLASGSIVTGISTTKALFAACEAPKGDFR